MRTTFAFALLIQLSSGTAVVAQDDLSRLVAETSPVPDIECDGVPADDVLSRLARMGGFEVYMTYEVRELAPLHFQCSEADDFADLLQLVLHHAGLRYTVPDANILLVSPAPRVPHKGWFRSSLPPLQVPSRLQAPL